jgi:hypothetical protein
LPSTSFAAALLPPPFADNLQQPINSAICEIVTGRRVAEPFNDQRMPVEFGTLMMIRRYGMKAYILAKNVSTVTITTSILIYRRFLETASNHRRNCRRWISSRAVEYRCVNGGRAP